MNAGFLFENAVPHISAYALTVEPKTALHNHIQRNLVPPVDSDEQALQFELFVDLAVNAGYEHYEISNFAKPGYGSRHNTSYWQGKPYYGFGPAAHSFNGLDRRRWNISNNALYIQSLQKAVIPFEEEILTITQQLNERIMIALRTSEGLNLEAISKNFGEKEAGYIKARSEKFIMEGLLELKENSLVLTAQGKFLADGIAADLFADDQIS
jgi:oxygen-independent coproporphyrinogen-3 oxidase